MHTSTDSRSNRSSSRNDSRNNRRNNEDARPKDTSPVVVFDKNTFEAHNWRKFVMYFRYGVMRTEKGAMHCPTLDLGTMTLAFDQDRHEYFFYGTSNSETYPDNKDKSRVIECEGTSAMAIEHALERLCIDKHKKMLVVTLPGNGIVRIWKGGLFQGLRVWAAGVPETLPAAETAGYRL